MNTKLSKLIIVIGILFFVLYPQVPGYRAVYNLHQNNEFSYGLGRLNILYEGHEVKYQVYKNGSTDSSNMRILDYTGDKSYISSNTTAFKYSRFKDEYFNHVVLNHEVILKRGYEEGNTSYFHAIYLDNIWKSESQIWTKNPEGYHHTINLDIYVLNNNINYNLTIDFASYRRMNENTDLFVSYPLGSIALILLVMRLQFPTEAVKNNEELYPKNEVKK